MVCEKRRGQIRQNTSATPSNPNRRLTVLPAILEKATLPPWRHYAISRCEEPRKTPKTAKALSRISAYCQANTGRCRSKMRMSGLCKVEMSGFIQAGRRDGTGANRIERERTGAMEGFAGLLFQKRVQVNCRRRGSHPSEDASYAWPQRRS
jgi:hypothetical protein